MLQIHMEQAQCCGTVVLACAGEQVITYVRCYAESRRQALIAKRLGRGADLVAVVRVAVAMAGAGL